MQNPQNIMRRPAVEATTGLSRSTLQMFVKSGNFPRPIRLGPKAVGWLASEVQAWIAARAAERDATAA